MGRTHHIQTIEQTMSTKKKTEVKVKGITELTMEKHKFEGFNVRMQKGGYTFRQYVSSGAKAQGAGSPTARREKARSIALELREGLESIVRSPKSWRNGALTKVAQKELKDKGFTIGELASV
jgi:hypothetical protein